MEINKLPIVGAVVNPMYGAANDPTLNIKVNGIFTICEDLVYVRRDGCYYNQCADGLTSFLYHSSDIVKTGVVNGYNVYKTTDNAGGYSGRTFMLKVNMGKEVAIVALVGPWSGGCYIANDTLPKPAIEAIVIDNNNHNMAIYLTIEKVNEILDKFCPLWSAITCEQYGHNSYPVLVYDNIRKPTKQSDQDIQPVNYKRLQAEASAMIKHFREE